MKKILISVLFVIGGFLLKAQVHPIQQSLADNISTMVNVNALRVKDAFILATYLDTAAMNAKPYLKSYNGALTRTTDGKIWQRFTALNKWVEFGFGGLKEANLPLSYDTLTGILSISVADSNNDGYLTAGDHTLFSAGSGRWLPNGTNIYSGNVGAVGIGNSTPAYKLDVTGKVRITDSVLLSKLKLSTGAAAGKFLQSDASGNASWQTVSGGGGVDSGAYRVVTQLADSSGFILFRADGTKDTILVNLGPGVGSYVARQNGISTLNAFGTEPAVFYATTPTGNPFSAIGPIAGVVLPHPSVANFGGVMVTDQEGNFFVRKNNGASTWRKLIDSANIASFLPPGTGLQIISGGAPGTYPTTPQLRTSIAGTAPFGSVGQVNGLVLTNTGTANYGGIIASDQTGAFWLKSNNSSYNFGNIWRKIIDSSNIEAYALIPTTGVGYSSVGNANSWTGNAMYYNGGTNIPGSATGLTGVNFPFENLSGYGNQLGFERFGKLYTRNNNGKTFGAWKQIAQYLEGSATFNAPSIASQGTTTTTITVIGAVLGDYAHVSFNLSLQGLIATAYVSAADTVTIILFNPTGSDIDLASASATVKAKTE